MSKINDFIQSVFKTTSAPADGNLKTTNPTPSQLNSNIPLNNQEAINALMTRLDDDKKPKPKQTANQTKYPAYELSLILPPGKKAIPYEALEINVIKDIFKQRGIIISNGAAEAIAEKAPLDFTPKWDKNLKRNVVNKKDGFYYRDFSFGKNSDMVLAGKQKNVKGVEFNGYKYYISSELQAAVLSEKDLALEVTKTDGKAFLEKTFNERFGMTIDKALADLPADIREKLKQVDAKTLLSAVMVGGVVVAALKKLPSEAVAVLAAGLTLKDVIQYGAEADHIADRIGKATKASDLPVAELKALITNGGLDILLAGVGYAGVKLAPKFTKLSKDALKLTDDAAREFEEAYRATKGKVADWANKVDDALSPGMVTPEGIAIKPPKVNTAKGSNVLEMRGDYRINVRKGSGQTGTGMEYAWRRHGNGNPINKSQFSIPQTEVEAMLQRRDVIQSKAVKDVNSGNYFRQVDVGKVIGRTPLQKGGYQTSVMTIITDEAGNLVNVFPGNRHFGANLLP